MEKFVNKLLGVQGEGPQNVASILSSHEVRSLHTGFVASASATAAAANGGGTINITVTSADPNEVVRALQTYVRQSGPVPVNTRTM
jgi:hypothetical protein